MLAFRLILLVVGLVCSRVHAAEGALSPVAEKLYSGEECSTCLEDYHSGGLFPLQLPCGHFFCVECLREWIQVQKRAWLKSEEARKNGMPTVRCPMCNKVYDSESMEMSFLEKCGSKKYRNSVLRETVCHEYRTPSSAQRCPNLGVGEKNEGLDQSLLQHSDNQPSSAANRPLRSRAGLECLKESVCCIVM